MDIKHEQMMSNKWSVSAMDQLVLRHKKDKRLKASTMIHEYQWARVSAAPCWLSGLECQLLPDDSVG